MYLAGGEGVPVENFDLFFLYSTALTIHVHPRYCIHNPGVDPTYKSDHVTADKSDRVTAYKII